MTGIPEPLPHHTAQWTCWSQESHRWGASASSPARLPAHDLAESPSGARITVDPGCRTRVVEG